MKNLKKFRTKNKSYKHEKIQNTKTDNECFFKILNKKLNV